MAPTSRSGAEAALLVLVLLTTSGVARAAAPRVPAVIVFGDSTVDTGNNNQIPSPLRADLPPYGRDMPGGPRATGRFGNGRLPPDLISEALGLPPLVPAYLDPAYGIDDFARGVCFASAGTGIDNATAGVLHFDQPLDNSKMEALTTLAEMSTGRKKVSAAAASAMGA